MHLPRTLRRAGNRRVTAAATAAVAASFALAVPASASTDTIVNNGWIYSAWGAWRSTINRVYVHDLAGGYGSCEDAENADGTWAQQYALCAYNGNDTYHDFCGCQTRRGFAESADNPFNPELMNAHQDY
jgi:hypothetical protein